MSRNFGKCALLGMFYSQSLHSMAPMFQGNIKMVPHCLYDLQNYQLAPGLGDSNREGSNDQENKGLYQRQ
jgi:hypothetical protein